MIEMRTAPGAEEELRSVFDRIATILAQTAAREPSFFELLQEELHALDLYRHVYAKLDVHSLAEAVNRMLGEQLG